jgi:hypothetical protein
MVPLVVNAATTDTVTITVTVNYISIANAPNTWAVGQVATSSTTATASNYFVVTNTSNVAITLTLTGANFSGGVAWTLSDTAAAGSLIVGLKAGTAGASGVIIKSSPGSTLVTSLAASTNYSWNMTFYAPTAVTDGVQKTGVVTITATAA